MKLNFSDLIPFEKLKNDSNIQGLEEGGIYLAYAIREKDGYIFVGDLLYIGKAESPSNNLGKRIKEHGKVMADQDLSDHGRWKKEKYLDIGQKIYYSFASMDDMTDIEDIEKKLIYLNKPKANSQNKDKDNSSEFCPPIEIIAPFQNKLIGYPKPKNGVLEDLKSDCERLGIKLPDIL